MMGILGLLAEALRYPAPGRLELLRTGRGEMPAGSIMKALDKFIQGVEDLSLAGWEELHTRTLDLGPLVSPYVGWQIWAENYQRSEFMALLNQAMRRRGVVLEGELPDHLIPVLRYLDAEPQPLPELVAVLEPSLRAMRETLHKAEPGNPYTHLLDAIWRSCRDL